MTINKMCTKKESNGGSGKFNRFLSLLLNVNYDNFLSLLSHEREFFPTVSLERARALSTFILFVLVSSLVSRRIELTVGKINASLVQCLT